MKNIIVTGATSMIGVALIQAALQDGGLERVYAVVRPETQRLCRLPQDKRIEVIACEQQDYDRLPALMHETCDVLYHLAWPRTPTYSENSNVFLKKSA